MKTIEKSNRSNFLSEFNLYSSSIDELLKKIIPGTSGVQSTTVVYTPNPEQIVLATQDRSFAKVLSDADYCIADGIGLVAASRLLSLVGKATTTPTHIPGVDLAKKLLHQAEENSLKVMVIGGMSYSGKSYKNWAIREIKSGSEPSTYQNSGKTLWWTHGYADAQHPTAAEERHVAASIELVKPDILFVAFGAPLQEQWVSEHRAFLRKNSVGLVMVVGGAFDMLLGSVRRAPLVMRKLGLEWLFRLIQEPWRWKRQLRLVTFVRLVVRDVLG